jgi:TonB-dependent SusC/RagA subfamily outer membrane receptor
MDGFLQLQLKSAIIIAISVVVYLVFLARDSFFQRNRVWLLTTLFVPWLMPLLAMPVWLKNLLFKPEVVVESIALTFDVPITEAVAAPAVSSFNWMNFGLGLYAVVSLFFLLRLLWGYYSISRLKRGARVSSYKGYRLVLLKDGSINPFSFFKTIYMPAHLERDKHGQMILEHERTHCAQLHSIDISLAEWLLIVQWWNPFVWWLRKLIAQNHEYCVDNAMVLQTNEPQAYQYSLLNLMQSNRGVQLVNNFNQSLTKKRIVMMNKENTSRIVGWTKNLLLIPLVGIALLAFSNPDKTKKAVSTDVEAKIENTNDLRNFIARSIKYPLEARDAGVEGTIIAHFDVDKKGKVSNVKIGSNPAAVQLDKVVVVAYAGEAGTLKQGSIVPEAAKRSLEEEVVRVVEKLPVIADKALVGKKLQMDFEFILQKKVSKNSTNLSKEWEGRTTNVINSKGDEFSVVVSEGRVQLQGPKNNQPLFVLDGNEVSWSTIAGLDLNEVRAIGHSPAGNYIKSINANAVDGAFLFHTQKFFEARKTQKNYVPSEPSMYLLDGEEVSKEVMDKIDVDKITNVNVLKGQAAVDKYGERAKDGVVEIATTPQANHGGQRMFKVGRPLTIDVAEREMKGYEPLYVVDGKSTKVNDVKAEDIESVSILNDEKAVELYGEEGKNGVIMIETKAKKTADEVVVVGYGSMKKGELSNMDNILVRRGERAEAVRIKGLSGDQQPYVILDGEEYTGSMEDLDPDKIQSISVLKDHTAEELYGDKAKNGVIIIESKK